MAKYNHYQFDLWLTLIKSNPEFKIERAKYFIDNFYSGETAIKISDIHKKIRKIEKDADLISEKTGLQVNSYEMIVRVLMALKYDMRKVDNKLVTKIYQDIEFLFFKYPPTVYDENTIPTLKKIHKSGATISILSNTGFIMGSTLNQLLSYLGIRNLFIETVYSDEIGFCKPSSTLYYAAHRKIIRWNNLAINTNEILHVGDNPIADIQGATDAGFSTFQINSNDKTIKAIPL